MHSSTFPCLDIAPRSFTTRTDPCLQGPNYQQINNPVVIQVWKFEWKKLYVCFLQYTLAARMVSVSSQYTQ